MNHLDMLEKKSIYVLREAFHHFGNLGMLWSIGKDSTVLVELAKKAFFGHIPFPLIHIDTNFKIPEMIRYRDQFVLKHGIKLIFGKNQEALKNKETFPDGNVDRLTCCSLLKTFPLNGVLDGSATRYTLDKKGGHQVEPDQTPFDAAIVGIRADEEGTRSKERYFSPRDEKKNWQLEDQPPEFWNQFQTEFPKGAHIRIHPLLDWREVDIWSYIERENIPTVSLYYDKGSGRRYRSLGCYPCTTPVESTARSPKEIITELESGKFSNIAERAGRAQDKADRGTLETLRRDGYM